MTDRERALSALDRLYNGTRGVAVADLADWAIIYNDEIRAALADRPADEFKALYKPINVTGTHIDDEWCADRSCEKCYPQAPPREDSPKTTAERLYRGLFPGRLRGIAEHLRLCYASQLDGDADTLDEIARELSATPEGQQAALLERALGALADIALSDDMTLKIARNKAKRIYDEIRAAAPIAGDEGKEP